MISNPYAPPRLGSDDPHQGIDFAYIDKTFQIAVEGGPVSAVIGGIVAAVIQDRFPYGNAILIETPLENSEYSWLHEIQFPTPAPTLTGHPILTCPKFPGQNTFSSDHRSLYIMYAHLKHPPEFQIGENVNCGQEIGIVGSSGNALNPHLHIETRIGPSNTTFESMAHYNTQAKELEMTAYCQWRVSNQFQSFDPMKLLQIAP